MGAINRRTFIKQSVSGASAFLLGALSGSLPVIAETTSRWAEKVTAERRDATQKVYEYQAELFKGINWAKDPEKVTGHERGHIPMIHAPKKVKVKEPFLVRIEIGPEEIHEMEVFHYIDWVNLYVGDVMVNHAILTPLYNRPLLSFELMLENSATLTAIEHCNLHGSWGWKHHISVSE